MKEIFHIRDIDESDIEKIYQLERKAFPDPWSIAGIKESLAQSYTKLIGAWTGEKLLGYAIMYFAADEGELVRIAADPYCRRRGVATGLLKELESVCAENGTKRMLLDVRKSNEAAISLYKRTGFKVDGIRKNFYTKPVESAVLMSMEIGN